MNALTLMYVGVGGAVGAMARYVVSVLVAQKMASPFPWATFSVNIVGAFLMGVWIAAMASMMPSRAKDLHLLFAVGALGGFTTFSAFTMDLFILIQKGLLTQAALYAFGSVLMSLAALIAGMWAASLVHG